MKIINKKYRVEKKLRELSGLIEYKVIEIKTSREYKLSILNESTMLDAVKKYLISNFQAIKNLNFEGIYSNYKLIGITEIDGIVVDKIKYSFLSEYSEAEVDYLEFLKTVEEELVCKGIFAVIRKLNTLNIKGFNYTNLTIGDLKIICERGKCSLKLPNILTVEFGKISKIFIKNNKIEYLNGIYLLGEKKPNIDDLVMILKQVVIALKDKDFKIIKALEKILEKNQINKFTNISELNEELNLEMKSENPSFILEYREKIDKDIDLVGRDIEIENIMDTYKEIVSGQGASKIVVFNGEDGVGKTKILETIKQRLEYNFNSPIFYVKKEEESIFRCNGSIENYNYTNGFKSELNKFLLDFSEKIKINYMSEEVVYTKEFCKSINNGLKLISEYSKLRPLVIVIDEFNELNLFMKLFLQQIAESISRLDNILVLLSVNQKKDNGSFEKYFKDLQIKKNITEYKVEALNKYYVCEFISKMISNYDGIEEIVDNVYDETFGNPAFILKKIAEMKDFKSIYINKTTGKWIFEKNRTFKNIGYITEKKYLDKIEILNRDEFSILKKLSLYKGVLREDLCLEKVIETETEMKAYLKLKEEKVIVESYDDIRKNIDFNDKFYKRVIYNIIEEKEKKDQHLKYIKLLEDICILETPNEEKVKYYLELIYHLEEIKRYKEVIKYTHLYVKELFKRGDDIQAINAYKRIQKYVDVSELSNLYMEIGDIYDKSEVYDKSLKYYKKANKEAISKEDKVLSALNIARVRIEKEEFKEASESMDLAKQNILDLQDNREIYARYFLVKALYENVEESIEFAKKALTICERENYKMLKGEVYLLLFKNEFIGKNYIKLEKYIKYCEEVFTITGSGRRYYKTLLYRAMLLMERDKEFKKAHEILKYVLKESKRGKINSIHYNTLIQLANLNCYLNKIENSKKYLLEGIQIIKTDQSLGKYLNTSYKYLLFLAVIRRDLKEVINYKNIMLDSGKESELDLEGMYAMYYYTLGDINKFKEITLENKEAGKCWLNSRTEDFLVEYNILTIMLCSNEREIEKNLIEIEVSLKKKSQKIYINTMVKICNLLYKLGYLELSKKIFLRVEAKNNMEKVEEKNYLIAINNFKHYSENTLLNKCMRVVSKLDDGMEKIDFYYIIGENYEMTKCYDLAFEAYYEGLISLSRYIKIENKTDRCHILGSNVFKRFFNRFMYCGNEKLNLNINLDIEGLSEEKIEKFLKDIKINNMLKNNKVKKLITDKYGKIFLNEYSTMEKVVGEFNEDVIHNIGVLMKYITRYTLATTAVLTINIEGEREIIYSYRNNDKELLDKIIRKKLNVEYFIANQETVDAETMYSELLTNRVKAIMCLNLKKNYGEGSRYKNIECELVLISEKLINNINKEVISEIKKYENSLIFLLEQHRITINSTRDKLTGAYNRGYFERTMDNILRDANYLKDTFSLIIFDIDNFKNINDAYGHQKGDIILQEISKIVSTTIDARDIFSRYGGEEFTIICPECNEEKTYEKAEKVRKAIDDAKLLRNKRPVTVSMGISTYPKHSKKKNNLIEKADQALYVAKGESKNVVKIWRDDFEGQGESTDRLAGLITGNTSSDYERIESLIEVVDIVKSQDLSKEKKWRILNKLVKNTESQKGGIFKIDKKGNFLIEVEVNSTREKENIEKSHYNYSLIEKVIKNKKGMYDIDWDEVKESLKTLPKWKSVCLVPIINNDVVKGIIYMYVPSKKKEFSFKDYNYINTIGNILSILY